MQRGFWYTIGQEKSVRIHEADFSPNAITQADSAAQLASHEDGYQVLWGTYFDSVNIKERANPKLHKQHVPLRYWRYLTEKRQNSA